MTVEAAIFRCSICGEPSTEICVYCTKDACGNHRCHRCKRCSDCCECEVPLSAEEAHAAETAEVAAPEPAAYAAPETAPEPSPSTFEPDGNYSEAL
jgi:hypothetical protein